MKKHVEYQKMYYGFPVILVSYYDTEGNPNMAAMSSSFSLGQMVTLGFASAGHTIQCIKEMKEFVINIPDRTLMEQIEICGAVSGRDHKKFSLARMNPGFSKMVNAPLIDECPINLECRVEEIIVPNDFKQYTLVVASVVGRLISDKLLNEDHSLDSAKVDPVLFIGDHHQRMYRYVDEVKSDTLGSFLPVAFKGSE